MILLLLCALLIGALWLAVEFASFLAVLIACIGYGALMFVTRV